MARPAVLVGYAAPAWGPGPSPYAYPAPPPPPSRTERGIAQFRWAVVVGIAMEALAITLVAYVASIVGSFGTSLLTPFDATFFSLLATMIGLTCVSGVVGLVGAVLFLIGLNHLYTGRDEYGPAHMQAIDRVIIFAILGIVFGIAAPIGGTATSAFLGFGSGFSLIGGANVVSGTLGTLRGLFVGLAFASALRAFQPEGERVTGLTAAILLAVSPAVAVVATLAFPLSAGVSTAFTLTAWLVAAAVAAAIDLVAYVLFFRMYSRTYHRMHAGEFVAMYRPPPMFVPYYPAPMPYYYPPYPAQPAPPPTPPQPPPQSPPPGA